MFDKLKRWILDWATPSEDRPDRMMFKSKDLNKWHYLGNNKISFIDESSGKPYDSTQVYFFVEKDGNTRSFVVEDILQNGLRYSIYSDHLFVVNCCELWRIGEKGLIDLIRDTPSTYLVNRMREETGYEWNPETKWWQPIANIEYKKAQQKQVKEKDTVVKRKTDSNIVSVDFKPTQTLLTKE